MGGNEAAMVIKSIWVPSLVTLGTVLNLLTIMVFCRRRMRKYCLSVSMMSLAIADTAVLLIPVLLTWIDEQFFSFYYLNNTVWCNLHGYVDLVSCANSSWIIILISSERWFAVCRPWHKNAIFTSRMVARTIISIFLLSVVLFAYFPLSVSLDVDKRECKIAHEQMYFIFGTLSVILVYVLPFVILAILNVMIIIRLRQRPFQGQSAAAVNPGASSSAGGAASLTISSTIGRKNRACSRTASFSVVTAESPPPPQHHQHHQQQQSSPTRTDVNHLAAPAAAATTGGTTTAATTLIHTSSSTNHHSSKNDRNLSITLVTLAITFMIFTFPFQAHWFYVNIYSTFSSSQSSSSSSASSSSSTPASSSASSSSSASFSSLSSFSSFSSSSVSFLSQNHSLNETTIYRPSEGSNNKFTAAMLEDDNIDLSQTGAGDQNQQVITIGDVTFMIKNMNYLINFFLYSLLSRLFRQELLAMISGGKKSRLSRFLNLTLRGGGNGTRFGGRTGGGGGMANGGGGLSACVGGAGGHRRGEINEPSSSSFAELSFSVEAFKSLKKGQYRNNRRKLFFFKIEPANFIEYFRHVGRQQDHHHQRHHTCGNRNGRIAQSITNNELSATLGATESHHRLDGDDLLELEKQLLNLAENESISIDENGSGGIGSSVALAESGLRLEAINENNSTGLMTSSQHNVAIPTQAAATQTRDDTDRTTTSSSSSRDKNEMMRKSKTCGAISDRVAETTTRPKTMRVSVKLDDRFATVTEC